MSKPQIIDSETIQVETWDEPSKGDVLWKTLFSQNITQTDDMCAGLAFLPVNGTHRRHRHAEAEIYYFLDGVGELTIDKQVHHVTPGFAAYIPGNAWHGLKNVGSVPIKLFYVFPTGSFSDIEYVFETEVLPQP